MNPTLSDICCFYFTENKKIYIIRCSCLLDTTARCIFVILILCVLCVLCGFYTFLVARLAEDSESRRARSRPKADGHRLHQALCG